MGLVPLLLACGAGLSPAGPAATAPTAPTNPTASAAPTARVAGRGVPPELCINELMPDDKAALILEDGSTPDWIELFNPTGADVSLKGWTLSDDHTVPDRQALSASLVVPAGGSLLLYADGHPELGPEHLDFSLDPGGEEVALFDPQGDARVLAFGRVLEDFAVARQTDCCEGETCLGFVFRGSPGRSNTPVVTSLEELRALGGPWAYWDGAMAPEGDWTSPDFDDSAWARGTGTLGYGDAQTTVISYGPDPNAKYTTAWFRGSFSVSDLASIDGLLVDLVRDDGAVVYLNGFEVARSNMPTGTVDASTPALAAVGGADETTAFRMGAAVAALVEGTNVLAVEVHQATPSSSDLSFDLGVTVDRVVSP